MQSPAALLADLHLRVIGAAPSNASGSGGHGIAIRRLVLSLTAAVLALLASLSAGTSWAIAVALGWNAGALVFLASVWSIVLPMDAGETAKAAQVEDASRAAADTMLLAAAVASLVSVGFVLVEGSSRSGVSRGLMVGLSVLSVALAWLTVHTIYLLRYARLYYGEPVGGIDFHADEEPDYRDLAYVALTIGMTFQVSDTDLTAKPVRQTAIRHALLSYLFGAVIIAITINIVGTLASAG